ncbi:MAG: DMT family transporter [Desulfobulbaceae bacterium]|jgi:drug/metabolite transporter (DMT)-like permease|nr:DMT family transporter [Desulfobulbaceae bacterium]
MDLTGIITAILSALFMGTVGVFARITGLGAETITLFRLLLGAGFMLCFLLATGQIRWVYRWPSWPVLLNGAMLAGFIILYVQAMAYTTMANAIMLVYLAPLTASICAHCFLGERLTRLSAGLIGLALIGFAMMMEFRIDLGGSSRHLLGIGFGLLSMLCYTAFILINRVIDERIHVYTSTFYQLLTGGLLMLPLCLLQHPELPMPTWPWLAATGLIPGFLAILCAVIALSRLPAATFGTLAYIEPIAVIGFGWGLFDETLSLLQISGCLLIVIGGILKTWSSVTAEAISKSASNHEVP